MPSIARRFVSGVLLVLVAACAGRVPRADPATPEPAGRLTRHVVVVSIDGLRPDAIARFHAPMLQRLAREGSVTLSATTVLPSKTLPSHVSMLTGVEPAVHGVEWNTDSVATRGVVRVRTVFGVARAAGFRTAALFSKAKLRHLQVAGTLDFTESPSRAWLPWPASRTAGDAVTVMRRLRPNLLFVHLGEPDYAGHALGWAGTVYGLNVRLADDALRDIVRGADAAYGTGQWTLVVTADHGGHGHDHGSADARDVTIPWIAWGEGVRGGTSVAAAVHTTDTAATALWLLGVPVPAEWSGRPVTGAFAAGAAAAR
ncbi:MAG TPA: alkaline phosphatase family protein [Gemmatimonadaceae bacterium]|nr:alkaline phosphatase family protein [Gemmatimonadaceae bacterium]